MNNLAVDDNTPGLSICPTCESNVYLCATLNPSDGKWSIVPIEVTPVPKGQGSFDITFEMRHSVLGDGVGDFPVAMHVPGDGSFNPHPLSHYYI